MRSLDLRFIGTILGLPVYVDVSKVQNIDVGAGVTKMSERDRKVMLIRTIMQQKFNPPKDEEE